MRTDSLQPGDLIQCRARGVSFLAEYEGHGENGWISVDPVDHWATWRWIKSRQVVRKLERQDGLGVAA